MIAVFSLPQVRQVLLSATVQFYVTYVSCRPRSEAAAQLIELAESLKGGVCACCRVS